MAEQDKKVERQTIQITEVGIPTQVKDKNFKKLAFKGTIAGVAHNYSTIKDLLFPLILLNTAIDCDVEIRPGTDITYYSVVQIYKDGQPIISKKLWRGDGYRGKSPEEFATERRSIERQTALKASIEYIYCDPERVIAMAEIFYQWISAEDKISPSKPKEVSTPTKEVTQAPTQGTVLDSGTVEPKNVTQLYTWMAKYGKKARDAHDYAIKCGAAEEQLKLDIPGAYRIIKAQNTGWRDYPD